MPTPPPAQSRRPRRPALRSSALLLALFLCWPGAGAADPGRPAAAVEIEALLARLAEDEDHAYLATLAPTAADCAVLFKRPADAERACAFADAMYARLDVLSDDVMKPATEDGAARVVFASPALIEAGTAHPVFAPYGSVTTLLRPEVTLYAIVFVDADGTPRKARSVLVEGDDRWVFVPQLQRAFED